MAGELKGRRQEMDRVKVKPLPQVGFRDVVLPGLRGEKQS